MSIRNLKNVQVFLSVLCILYAGVAVRLGVTGVWPLSDAAVFGVVATVCSGLAFPWAWYIHPPKPLPNSMRDNAPHMITYVEHIAEGLPHQLLDRSIASEELGDARELVYQLADAGMSTRRLAAYFLWCTVIAVVNTFRRRVHRAAPPTNMSFSGHATNHNEVRVNIQITTPESAEHHTAA